MKRRRAANVLLALPLAALLAAPAAANFQARGRFLYKDREYGITGFTGNEPNLPIRLADVEVFDASTSVVLATGATDLTGNFALQVTDSQTRNIGVRVKTTSNNTSTLHILVRDDAAPAPYAIFLTFTNHAPTTNIDFSSSPGVALPGNGGEGFNIFDVALDGMDFIATLNGSRPSASQSLTLYWPVTGQCGYFSPGPRSIFLCGNPGDSDGYDDSVILHETGHFTEYVLSASDNPGLTHQLDDCNPNLSLAWSEGYATFFQNMVRNWKGLSRPDIYVDTSGAAGPGGALLGYQVETPLPPPFPAGSGNEYSVNAVLWDMVDRPTTLDASPGTDDDPMNIADAPARFWDVFINYIPNAANISIEDFWDGWFTRGKGFANEMRQIFAGRGMEYSEDTYEQDDNKVQAQPGGVASAVTHHTIYPAGDADWIQFAGVAGGSYTFQTQNLPCGSDTRLRLYDSDGTTVLASNDDVGAPDDLSSRIQYTPVKNGALYLELSRKADGFTYTSCDLSTNILVPVLVTDVQLESTAEGVLLRWHGQREAGFSHFDVERAGTALGPWEVRNEAPILSEPRDPTLFAYLDRAVEPGANYFYRLVGVEENGEKAYFGPYAATAAAPARLALLSPRPNPFNPRTEIRLDLPRQGAVWLRIYDASGRLVRTLVGGATLPPGTRAVSWDGSDDAGRAAASGVYFVRLEALGLSETRRAVLAR